MIKMNCWCFVLNKSIRSYKLDLLYIVFYFHIKILAQFKNCQSNRYVRFIETLFMRVYFFKSSAEVPPSINLFQE